jgi:hypothetical protein
MTITCFHGKKVCECKCGFVCFHPYLSTYGASENVYKGLTI